MDKSEYQLDRPFDKLRAKIRFFWVIIGMFFTNIPYGSTCFMFVWWFRDWCYWNLGVAVMHIYLRLAKIKVIPIGLEKLNANKSAVFVSSHQSHFDIAAAMAHLPIRWYFIAKKELWKIPIFGQALGPLGMYMIDRSSTEKAYESIQKAADDMKTKVRHILLYPEGGISKSGKLQRFKKGAFILAIQAGVPIIPIMMRDSVKLFSSSRMECRPGTMIIEVLDEIDTSGYTMDTNIELMEKVYRVMKEAEERRPDIS